METQMVVNQTQAGNWTETVIEGLNPGYEEKKSQSEAFQKPTNSLPVAYQYSNNSLPIADQ